MITQRNLLCHELVGLQARVAESSDPSLVGTEGRVVEETAHTFVVSTDGNGERTVPKGHTDFEFEVPDAGTTVRVEGEATEARPAERVRSKTRGV